MRGKRDSSSPRDRHESERDLLQKLLSDATDTDRVEAAVDVQLQQTALEAALRSSAGILGLSLLDFL